MKSPNITIVNKYGRPELTVHTLDYIKADAKPQKKYLTDELILRTETKVDKD